jgi:2-polyprenyl-3-methyl-5-hydroxy-6-metoxy-1,4-benzoquinol methylase
MSQVDSPFVPDPETSLEPRPSGDGSALYGAYYYRHDCGVPYERNEHWLTFFGEIAENIIRDLHPASVMDAGCGMGFLVEALRQRGVEAWGIDVSEYAISQVHESVRDYCSVASLSEPFPRRYDLITCIEVVEHIPAAEIDEVIANLCKATHRLLLSTSPHDYGEATHVNVRPPQAWSAMLARDRFLRDFNHDASYLTPWTALYTRREESLTETVRRYDESWWRLRWEVSEMRNSLLALHERLESIQSGETSAGSEELERRQEEILRLRDLVIGKDAELGAIRGRIAELEEQAVARRYASITQRLQARLFNAARARFRRLRNPSG